MGSKKKFVVFASLLMLAGVADVKYKGLFYRSLPKQIQTTLDTLFHKS